MGMALNTFPSDLTADREVRISHRPHIGFTALAVFFLVIAVFARHSIAGLAVGAFAFLWIGFVLRGLPWKVFLTDKAVVRTHLVGPPTVWCLYEEMESISSIFRVEHGAGIEVKMRGKPTVAIYQKGMGEPIEPVAREMAARAGCPISGFEESGLESESKA